MQAQAYTLENDHNVYILGAGFSADAGLPVMSTFLARMRDSVDWFTQQERTAELDAIRSVLAFRLLGASSAYRVVLDLENIEELFSLASAMDADGLAIDMQRAMAATLDFCSETSLRLNARAHTIVLGPNAPLREDVKRSAWPADQRETEGYDRGYLPVGVPNFQSLLGALLGELSEPSPLRQNTFISFNYDLLVEHFLHRLGVGISYGIPEDRLKIRAPWHDAQGTRVLKLHGSINWAASDDPTKLVAYSTYSECRDAGRAPLLLPPTWRKDFGQLATVWQGALDALKTATRIVVIGFSMPLTDQHFRYLLAAGLRDNISLRQIVFVDPMVAGVKTRALRILRPELERRGLIKFIESPAMGLLDQKSLRWIGRPLARDTAIHNYTPKN
jgi:hypothetical protein